MSIHYGNRLLHKLSAALCVISARAVFPVEEECTASSCSSHLLQTGLALATKRASRDLVLMHIPYNFGHTLEYVAYFPTAVLDELVDGMGSGYSGGKAASDVGELVEAYPMKPGGELWGHLNPELQVVSNQTGCPMYYTPPKYWPSDLAKRYFGNKQVFGLFRNPYERLVSLFRGNFEGYGGGYGKLHDNCDVNAAVKLMMKRYLAGDKYSNGCTFLPQTEYIDMPHGVTLPIDLQAFPNSMNAVLAQHGYDNLHIRTKDIMHVGSCDNVWAGDLDNETRAMVKQVYKRDFEFLCKTFGYCDQDKPVCLQGVPHMCPEKEFTWNETQQRYQQRSA
eukprot:TRINITY_DN4839_c0_g1_i1.p1 TRINITY_DN4839_c0_g1~~TRINITY_DN4839_c0_g1_i1.p1  ORF type:complete len:363 (+),score=55.68 TRINITY_DN4839_c0_g1_i1:86-1090(+)